MAIIKTQKSNSTTATEQTVNPLEPSTAIESWVTNAEAQKLLGVSRATLCRYRKEDPSFPKPKFLGRKCLFKKTEIVGWFNSRLRDEPLVNLPH